MGYQQSFVKFKDIKTLNDELIKYKKRDKKHHQASVYGVVKTIRAISPFKEGELALIIGGERYAQRGLNRLRDELEIENAQEVVFIDNPQYYEMSDGDLGKFLDAHFINLTEEEFENMMEIDN